MGKLSSTELEKKNLQFEIFRIGQKYGVKSSDELYEKIEKGEISETTEVFYDFMELEYLEEQLEKLCREGVAG